MERRALNEKWVCQRTTYEVMQPSWVILSDEKLIDRISICVRFKMFTEG